MFLRALSWGRYYLTFSFNDLDEAIEGILIKFADDTKLGGVANTSEEWATIQEDLGKLGHSKQNEF